MYFLETSVWVRFLKKCLEDKKSPGSMIRGSLFSEGFAINSLDAGVRLAEAL